MRSTFAARAALLLLLLGGCATTDDPSKGGLVSGLHGIVSGSYKRGVADAEAGLREDETTRAEAEAAAGESRAQLAARRQQVAALRTDVAILDRSIIEQQAAVARLDTGNTSAAGNNQQLSRELAAVHTRLRALRGRLQSDPGSGEYEVARREYLDAQAALAAVQRQLARGSR